MIGCCTLHTDPGLVGDRLQRLDLRGQIQPSDRFSWKPGLIFPQWQAGCDWVSSACARQFLAQKSAWDSNFKTLHRNLRRLWTMTIFTWVVNNWQITWHVCLSSFFVLWKKISRIFYDTVKFQTIWIHLQLPLKQFSQCLSVKKEFWWISELGVEMRVFRGLGSATSDTLVHQDKRTLYTCSCLHRDFLGFIIVQNFQP